MRPPGAAPPAPRRRGAAAAFLALQFVVPTLLWVVAGAPPAAAAPAEAQDAVTEVITARFDFNGTEGSTYSATTAGPGGLTLGLERRTASVGFGDWGAATYLNTTWRYPGDVVLGAAGTPQGVYAPNASSITRYTASGTTQWTSPAGPRAQMGAVSLDADGDGFLDDVAVANDQRRVVVYSQAGTSLGNANLQGGSGINDLLAIDVAGAGFLGQLLVADQSGRAYLFTPSMAQVWRYDTPSADPVVSLAAADFDGDGLLEDAVAATDAGDVYAVRGTTNPPALSWSYRSGAPTVAVFGLDTGGTGRLGGVLVGTTGWAVALNSSGSVVWNYTVANATISAIAPVDLDGDGLLEEAVLGLSNGTLIFLAAGGTYAGSFAAFGSPVVSADSIDLDGDGFRDAVVAANATEVVAASGLLGPDWRAAVGPQVNRVRAVDLDGWGCACDTVVASSLGVRALAANGTERWNVTHAAPVYAVTAAANPTVAAAGAWVSEPVDAQSDAGWEEATVTFSLPNANTAVSWAVRYGSGALPNLTWGNWSAGTAAPQSNLSGNTSRFIQVRVNLTSLDGVSSPRLSGVRINYTVPAATGSATTPPVAPPGSHQFLALGAMADTSGGGAVRYLYSADGGASWRPYAPGAAVDPPNASAPALAFRVELDAGTVSPTVAWVSVSYVHTARVPAIVWPPANQTLTGAFAVAAVCDPAIVSVSFEWFDPAANATTPIGAASYNASSARWEAVWDTSGTDASGVEVVARATDGRGFSFASRVGGLRVDNTPPTPQVVFPTADSNLTGVVAVQAIAPADVESVGIAYFDGSVWQSLGGASQSMPGAWSLVWNTTAMGTVEGGRLSVTATDEAGLVGAVEVFPVTVDNDAPWVRVDSPLPGATLMGTVPVALTAAPDATVVEVRLNNGSYAPATATDRRPTFSTWSAGLPTSGVTFDGAASVEATVRDRVDFTGANVSSPYVVDNRQVDAVLRSPLPETFNTGTVLVSAQAPPQTSRIAFYYNDTGDPLPTFIRQLELTDKNASTGLWEFTWDTRSPTKVEFNGTILMFATSMANETRWSTSSSWVVVDNTAPYLAFLAPTVTDKRLSGQATVRALASDDVVSVQLSYENQSSGQVFAVGAMARVSASEWSYSWNLTGVFVPSATLRLVAVDRVGFRAWANLSDAVLGLVPGDAPPAIVRTPSDIFLDEDFGTFALNLSGLVTDDDPANLTAYLDGAPSWLVTLRNNGSRGLAPIYLLSVANAHSGPAQSTLRLRVVDRSGQSASATFGLYIAPVNDPPRWADPPSVVFVRYGVPYELDFTQYIRDAEFEAGEQAVSVSASDSAHIVANASRPQSLIFSYTEDFANQSANVVLSLQDSAAGATPALHALEVRITSDWVPELVRPIPKTDLMEDTPRLNIYNLYDYFFDRDMDQLFYYRGATNITVRIDPDGNVSVIALPADWYGTQTVFFGARDSHGAFAESRAEFEVHPVNDAPRWAFSALLDYTNYSVRFDVEYPLPLGEFVYDVDNPPEELSANTSDPAHAYPPASGGLLLLINYPESMNGTTQVLTVWVSDGIATSEPVTLRVRVTDNYPPAIVQPFPQEIVLTEGEVRPQALMLRDYFQDRDGVLFFYYGAHNITVKIDNVTGAVTLEAPGEWNGSERIVFRAVDDRGAFQDAVVLVTVLAVDDPPRLSYIQDFVFDAGRFYEILLAPYASDPDTSVDALIFSATSNYPNASVILFGSRLQLIYPEGEGAPAFDALKVCVSDGGAQPACRTIAVKVNQPVVNNFDWLRFFIFMGAVGVSSIVAARHFFEFKVRRPPTVEDVFLVYEDGILIKHYSKQVRKFADDDVVTSMLSAIQSFAADSFEDTENWELREISFQGRKILIERARKFQIFVIFDGDSNEDLKRAVRKAADSIARAFEEPLRDWDGDPSHFDTAREHFGKLLAMQQAFVPAGVSADELRRAPLGPGAVFLSEAGDFSPILDEYQEELEGVAAIRLRPQGDAGVPLTGLDAEETLLVEIPPPMGVPGDEDALENGLDVALVALKDALEEATVAVRNRPPVVFFEGFEYVVERYGFVFSKKFADQLKRIATGEGFCLLIAVNPPALSPNHLEALERDTVVFRAKR